VEHAFWFERQAMRGPTESRGGDVAMGCHAGELFEHTQEVKRAEARLRSERLEREVLVGRGFDAAYHARDARHRAWRGGTCDRRHSRREFGRPNRKLDADFLPTCAARLDDSRAGARHAWCARNVLGQLSGKTPDAFVLQGEDWFALSDESALSWSDITMLVETEQQRLATEVAALPDGQQLDVVLGITCHAIYHAGQIQLIKRLHGG
jgi:hypothetical protein